MSESSSAALHSRSFYVKCHKAYQKIKYLFPPSLRSTFPVPYFCTVHDKIREGAIFNFNYICLLVIASFVAGLGLISDSSTIVVSSMLLSPIMGPVIGMAYGLIVLDWKLVRNSIRNELISLFICIIIGMIVCVGTAWTNLALETWPTNEMSSRGELTNFLVGIPVAWLSGLGVASLMIRPARSLVSPLVLVSSHPR